jgi:DNA-binding XRE family transcriptional regulator
MRTERGLSQEVIAHRVGLTLSAYGRIEGGKVAPGWSAVRAIGEVLDISMKEFGSIG